MLCCILNLSLMRYDFVTDVSSDGTASARNQERGDKFCVVSVAFQTACVSVRVI